MSEENMSTKETLPPDEEFIKWAWNNGLGWIDSDNLSRMFKQVTDSLRTRLDAAEKELETERKNHSFYKELSDDFEKALGPHPTFINGCWVQRIHELRKELTQLKEANAELVKDRERVSKLANLIWQTRWVSEDSDYQDLVGIAAEIRSGNFNGIDAAIDKGTQ